MLMCELPRPERAPPRTLSTEDKAVLREERRRTVPPTVSIWRQHRDDVGSAERSLVLKGRARTDTLMESDEVTGGNTAVLLLVLRVELRTLGRDGARREGD